MGQCWGTASEAGWEQGLFALSALSVSDCKTLSARFSVWTNIESVCFTKPQLETLLKPMLNCIPFLTSALSNPTRVNISGYVSGLCFLHALKIQSVLLFYNHPYCKQNLFEANPAHLSHPLKKNHNQHPNTQTKDCQIMIQNVRKWRGKITKEINKAIVGYLRGDAISIICIRTNEFH